MQISLQYDGGFTKNNDKAVLPAALDGRIVPSTKTQQQPLITLTKSIIRFV